MKVGVIFPGYGSQFVGMGKEFYDGSRTMQEHFDLASQCLGINFVKLCFASSDAEISELEKAYMVLFVTGLSIGDILKEKGVTPSLVAGYDVGEYSALAVAGGITLPDALYLLKKFAGFFEELLKNRRFEAIRVSGISKEELQKVIERCINGNQVSYSSVQELEEQFVVVGTVDSLACVRKGLGDLGISSITTASLGGGLHSPLMDSVLKNIKMYLEKVDFKSVVFPFAASVTGQVLKEGDAIRAAVMQQIHAPLRWYETMKAFTHCDVIAVVGECSTTKELCDKLYPDKKTLCIMKPADIDELAQLYADAKKDTHDTAK